MEKSNNITGIILSFISGNKKFILSKNQKISEGGLDEIVSLVKNDYSKILEFKKHMLPCYLKIIWTCIDNKKFSKEDYVKNIDPSYWESIVAEKKSIPKATPSEVKKWKVFTEKEIREIEQRWENMYSSIPWDAIPKEDNIFYANTQLKRFIDAPWSQDFIIETNANDKWEIATCVKFKFWERMYEIQDSAAFKDILNESDDNDNPFFDRVRKYIWWTLAEITADSKAIVHDWWFTFEHQQVKRRFRFSAFPTKIHQSFFPRYTLRLATDWNWIDFWKFNIIPFQKEKYNHMINSEESWLIIITWPTWSWKTTTIYWMINAVDKKNNCILSVEKPIEAQLSWIQQSQEDLTEMDAKTQYKLIDWLKAILRQAPETVFVW